MDGYDIVKCARIVGKKSCFVETSILNVELSTNLRTAIMLCEGGFSLMETDEMNYQILQNAANALKPNGKLIFTTLNGLFPFFHSVKNFLNSEAQEGNAAYTNHSFDLMTFRESNTIKIEDDSGNKKKLKCNERYYVLFHHY